MNKSELEKVLERQKRLREEREREEEKEPETPFQRMLAERAKRLEQVNLKGICRRYLRGTAHLNLKGIVNEILKGLFMKS